MNEACRAIGIGRTKLYEEINSGRISTRKLGKRTLILAKEIDRYLEALPTGRAI
jgi:excisionase family DNA binding protein